MEAVKLSVIFNMLMSQNSNAHKLIPRGPFLQNCVEIGPVVMVQSTTQTHRPTDKQTDTRTTQVFSDLDDPNAFC